jgi:hypothetical protein
MLTGMKSDVRDSARAALDALRRDGSPVVQADNVDEITAVGWRRWNSFERRDGKRSSDFERRVEDLAKGLRDRFEHDPSLAGPLIEDDRPQRSRSRPCSPERPDLGWSGWFESPTGGGMQRVSDKGLAQTGCWNDTQSSAAPTHSRSTSWSGPPADRILKAERAWGRRSPVADGDRAGAAVRAHLTRRGGGGADVHRRRAR